MSAPNGFNSLSCIVRTSRQRSCNQRVVCYIIWLGSMIYGMGLWTSTRCMVGSLVVVRMAIDLKSAPPHIFIQIHTTYIINIAIICYYLILVDLFMTKSRILIINFFTKKLEEKNFHKKPLNSFFLQNQSFIFNFIATKHGAPYFKSFIWIK